VFKFTFKDIHLLVCSLYIFSIPWQNAITISSFGTLSKLLGLVVVAAGVVKVFFDGDFTVPRYAVIFFVFIIYSLIMTIANMDSLKSSRNLFESLDRISIYFQLIVVSIFLSHSLQCKRCISVALLSWLLGNTVLAVIVIYRFTLDPLIFLKENSRVAIDGFNQNGIAINLALGFPVCYLIYSLPRGSIQSRILKIFSSSYVVVSFVSLLLTGSRGGLAVFFVINTYYLFRYKLVLFNAQKKLYIFTFFASFFLFYIIYSILKINISAFRVFNFLSDAGGVNLNGRDTLWRAGLDYIAENPFFGVGIGNFGTAIALPYTGTPLPSHNLYISVWAEAGIVGVLLYLGTFVYSGFKFTRKFSPILFCNESLLIGLCTSFLTANLDYSKVTFFILTIVATSGKGDLYGYE